MSVELLEIDRLAEMEGVARGAAIVPPRGPLSAWLCHHLTLPTHELPSAPVPVDEPYDGEDSALALYLCYELHYRGLPGVDDRWEWEPSVLRLRRQLEDRFLASIYERIGTPAVEMPVATIRDRLVELSTTGGGRSLSAHMSEMGTVEEIREFCAHRSLYQLKEADPHTFAIPRLEGRSKAAMVAIQVGEYGDGKPDRVHAHLFGQTMEQLGLDRTYGAYLPIVPAVTLATVNLVSLFGLHRAWRGSVVGHLALFEMCSVGPMGRYAAALRRFGCGDLATDFYDEHVLADEVHQVIALEDMATGLAESDPALAGSIIFGAQAVKLVEQRFADHLLDSWNEGLTSLLQPLSP